MNKKFFLLVFITALAFLLVAGCGNTEPTPEPPAEQPRQQSYSPQLGNADGEMVFASSIAYPGCLDCHKKISEEESYTLTIKLAQIKNHPVVSVESVQDCVPCHTPDDDTDMLKIAHQGHYLGGAENDFVSNYDGSCVHCHKLAEDGAVPVADLAAEGTAFVPIEVALIDEAPNGCLDCHQETGSSSLAASIAKIEGHPAIDTKTTDDCFSCHQEGSFLPFGNAVHKRHLQGEDYKNNYGNSCLNCHDNGIAMPAKGM